MKNMKPLSVTLATVILTAGLSVQPAQGANLVVTNTTLTSALYAGRVADVKFDVSWDASWRASWTESGTCTNWDAAWIFVKYRNRAGANTNWNHASLSTNNSEHTAPTTNCTINVGLSTNAGGADFGAGVFLYRSAEDSGSWTNTGVKLRWRYGDDGVATTDRVDVCVHAIEMVYVPQGSFYVGDGCTGTGVNIKGHFENGQFTNAFQVTNENYIIYLGGGTNGNLGNNNAVAMDVADDFNDSTTQTLPAAFPKGYNAFYCMKYKISQGQYVGFLNKLTNSTQATARYPNQNGNTRHTISGSWPAYTSSAPTRACNYISWADGTAYADWAGLRPITELEYEKACRGPLYPVTNEYVWGNTTITGQTGHAGTDGSGTETASPASANACYNSGISGPVRCGIFATASSDRQSAGASYWGIMEMSGNLWEQIVTVGNPTGRVFTCAHGNGKLTSGGDADAPTWPGTNTVGMGIRGGAYGAANLRLRVSERIDAAIVDDAREPNNGWRLGRSAP